MFGEELKQLQIPEAPEGYDESKIKKEDIDDLDNKDLNNVLLLLKEGKNNRFCYIITGILRLQKKKLTR